MRNKRGSIELLLLLCCLVGVIAMFSLSLGLSNAFREPLQNDDLVRERLDLEREKGDKEKQLSLLDEERKRLEQEIKEAESRLTDDGGRGPEIEVRKLEEELVALTKERDLALRKTEELKKELAFIPVAPNARTKEENQKELEALRKRLDELESKIKRKSLEKEAMARTGPEAGAAYSEKEAQSLRGEIARVQATKTTLKNEISNLRTKIIIGGNSAFKNPLYVECRKDIYIFYPKGETLGVAELDKRDIFKERAGGHDIIVLYVRPDGFSSFGKAFGKVKVLPVALCYEPADVDQPLNFLKG
jgi:hypothetical protein